MAPLTRDSTKSALIVRSAKEENKPERNYFPIS